MVGRRSLLLAVLALSVVVPAGVALASPSPSPVCEVCGGAFEGATLDEEGYHADVTRSTLDVYLRSDGSARRVVRNRVNASVAAYFRENPATLERIVRDALPSDRREVTVRVEGRTVVVESVAPDAAHRSFGVLVYDQYRTGHRSLWTVNANRFTVHAPEDHRLESDPSAPERNATAVTWTGETENRYGIPATDSFDHRTFVAFTREGAVAPGAMARLARAASVAPIFLRQLAIVMTPATLALVGALAVTAAIGRRPRNWDARAIGAGLFLLGAFLVAATVTWVESTNAFYLAPVALGVGLLVHSVLGHPRVRPPSLRETFLATTGLSGIATVVALLVGLGSPPGSPEVVLAVAVFPVELGLFAVLGYARGIGDPARYGVAAALVLPAVAFAVWQLPVYGGFAPLSVGIMVTAAAVPIGVIGVPLYCLGVAVSRDGDG